MSQNKIFVGSLAYAVSSNELEEFFSQYGDIESAKVITDRETGRSKGFAFITFVKQQSAEAALEANGTSLKGRNIIVNMAKEDDRRTGGGGGRGAGGGGGRGGAR